MGDYDFLKGLCTPVAAADRPFVEQHSGFRSLAWCGFPNYAININGACICLTNGHVLAPYRSNNRRLPTYRFTYDDNGTIRETKRRIDCLVAESFWDVDTITGPYAERIRQVREFYLIPANQKRHIPLSYPSQYNYVVDTEGRVWNAYTKDILIPQSNSILCSVKLGGHSVAVHKLMAQMFLQKPADDSVLIFVDGNPKNLRLSNIKWVSRQEYVDYLKRRRSQRTGGRLYKTYTAITPFVAKVIRENCGEEILQTCLAQEIPGFDYEDYQENVAPTADDESQS